MKKIAVTLSALVFILALVSCGSKRGEVLHLGVNAVITEVDAENEAISLRDPENEGIFNEKCIIDCTETPIIYCNYSTGEVKMISFADLQIDDSVILSIYDSEMTKLRSGEETIRVDQVQLGTQRLE